MSLDAGTIAGRLDLDTTSFKKGFSEAHTHAETEGGAIREKMEAIAEVLTEAVGPALGQFANQLQSALAGFSEGPVVGSLNLIGIAAGQMREMLGSAAGEFQTMGLAAQRAGINVEEFSGLARVAESVGIGVDQLGQGFKILEQRAEEAAGGNTRITEAFNRLGISADELGRLMDSPAEMFQRVKAGIDLVGPAERSTAALGVLGKAGASLVPLFAMSRDEFDQTRETIARLGGTVSDQEADLGHSTAKIEEYFKSAWAGIEAAVSKPILQALHDHMAEITPRLESLTNGIVAGITSAWSAIADESRHLLPELKSIWDELEKGGGLFDQLKQGAGELVTLGKELAPAFEAGLELFVKMETVSFKAIVDGLKMIEDSPIGRWLADIVHWMDELIGRVSKFLGDLDKYNEAINDPKYRRFADMNPTGDRSYEATTGLSNENLRARLNAYRAVENNADAGVRTPLGAGLSSDQLRQQLQAAGAVMPDSQLSSQMGQLSDHIQGLTNTIQNTRPTSGTPDHSINGGGSSGGPSTRPSTQPVAQTVHVSINYDQTDTVHQLAQKLLPQIRQAQQRINERNDGALAVAMAQMSMGGVG